MRSARMAVLEPVGDQDALCGPAEACPGRRLDRGLGGQVRWMWPRRVPGTRGRAMNARAMAINWRSPEDNDCPPLVHLRLNPVGHAGHRSTTYEAHRPQRLPHRVGVSGVRAGRRRCCRAVPAKRGTAPAMTPRPLAQVDWMPTSRRSSPSIEHPPIVVWGDQLGHRRLAGTGIYEGDRLACGGPRRSRCSDDVSEPGRSRTRHRRSGCRRVDGGQLDGVLF